MSWKQQHLKECISFPKAFVIDYRKLNHLKQQTFILTPVLEAKNLKPRCQQGHAPSESSRRESFLASSRFWWLHLFFGSITPVSPFIFTMSPSLCLLFLYRHQWLGLKCTLIQDELTTRSWANYIWKTLFLNKINSKILDGHEFVGDSIQPTTDSNIWFHPTTGTELSGHKVKLRTCLERDSNVINVFQISSPSHSNSNKQGYRILFSKIVIWIFELSYWVSRCQLDIETDHMHLSPLPSKCPYDDS